MRNRYLRAWPIAMLFITATSAPAADTSAPRTPTTPITDTYNGVAVTDPYRWLEKGDDPAVQAWSDAQNTRTRAYLDALPERGPIKDELTRLVTKTSPYYYGLKRGGGSIFAMYSQPPKQQPMLAMLGLDADPAKARIVVDPNAIDSKGATAIDWFVPSPDGQHVAVSLSKGGSEDGTLHVFDTATGKERGDPIPNVQYPTAGGSLAWSGDSKGFWYTRYPEAGPAEDRHFYQQVYFHKLGAAPADKDTYSFGKELLDPKIAEILLSDGPLATVEDGDSGRYSIYALTRGQWGRVAGWDEHIIAAAFGPDHALYLVSQKNAPRGRILKLKPGDLDITHATEIVPQSDGAIDHVSEEGVLPFAIAGDRIYVKLLVGGPSRVDIYDLGGKRLRTLPLPDIAAADEVVPAGGKSVIYSIATYLRPPYFARYNSATGKSADTKLVEESPTKFDDAEVVRDYTASKDGTKIPINIIRLKGTKRDGSNPTLLYGYGGYGISMTPRFLGAEKRIWLDGGGVYAIANIRGGGEYGDEWHREGALTRKQNVFDDFFAAAGYILKAGYTTPKRLAIMGGSNGGLLMGAELTQHPAEFHAVVSQVGIYDMLRVELDPNGAFNTTEFGTVKDPDQFKALYAYSPYHNVKDGTAYPAVLFMTGANDGRVNPMQSRKMTARLQAATTGGPVYLRTSADSGHGFGSALTVRIEQGADYLAFLFDQLGMELGAATRTQ